MSDKNKKSVASRALLDMDNITAAIKEESEKTIKTLYTEAVRDALRENCEKEEAEDDFEIEDTSKDSKKKNSEKNATSERPEKGEEGEWDFAEKYKVGDDTYDLTNEKDYNSVVKVFKLLGDDDKIVAKKEGGVIRIQDDNAGTEYVIDINDSSYGDGLEVSSESLQEGLDIAGIEDDDVEEGDIDFDVVPDEELESDDDDLVDEFELDVESDDDDLVDDELVDDELESDDEDVELDVVSDDEPVDEFELDAESDDDDLVDDELESDDDDIDAVVAEHKKIISKTRMPEMRGKKEVLFEVDLGITDNYQNVDPIDGLSNEELSRSGKSWHKGVPTGTNKPWAGPAKSKSKPYGGAPVNEEEVADMDYEMDEQTNVGGFVQQNSVTTSHVPNTSGRKARSQRGSRVTPSTEPRYGSVSEVKLKKENKELKEAILAIRKNLQEAYVTNANLGKITKLFLENTTSQAEKIDIVNRFSNEAKTIEQSNKLFESISKELQKGPKSGLTLNESNMSIDGSSRINENKVYKSSGLLKAIDLMNRLQNR